MQKKVKYLLGLELVLPRGPAWCGGHWDGLRSPAVLLSGLLEDSRVPGAGGELLLLQNFSLYYKGQSGKQGGFLKCCALFEGSVWFTRMPRCSNCQGKRANPEERREHPLAGGVPLSFPRQLSKRCLFLQSRLGDLKEPMLPSCPKPLSMWPTHSHCVPWPFPIAYSKSITWKIALLSSPEALETASKLCDYKQFQLGQNAIPASGSQDP